ncbi:MAG: hypothetical protein V1889_01665 [archaeon]
MVKPSDVKFISMELKNNFDSMDDDDPVKKAIVRAMKNLSDNAFSGVQIPKRLFPEDYIQKYGITNLWKYDLPNAWRLLYAITIEGDVRLISVILDWFSHKDYERKFNYG